MRARVLRALVLSLAAVAPVRRDVHRHQHERLRRRVAAPGDRRRQPRRRRRHDRLCDPGRGGAYDRPRLGAPLRHRRRHDRRLHAAGLVAEHAAARSGHQRRAERRSQRRGRDARALFDVGRRRRTHPGLDDQPLPDRGNPGDRLDHDYGQLHRHDAAGRAAHRQRAPEQRDLRPGSAVRAGDDGRRRRRAESRRPQPDLGTHVLPAFGGRPVAVSHPLHPPGKPHRRRRNRVVRDLQRRRRVQLLQPAAAHRRSGPQRWKRGRAAACRSAFMPAPTSSRATSSGPTRPRRRISATSEAGSSPAG